MISLREAQMHRFPPSEPNFKKNFRFGEKNSFWHDLSSGSAYAPIFSSRKKKFRFGQKNSFWHDLSSGSANAPISSFRAEFQKNFRFGQRNSFWHDLGSGSANAPIFFLRAEFQKISDSAGKIHFGMISTREAQMHRFSF